MEKLKNSNWQAWFNCMPGQEPTLHVTGSVDVGNSNESYTMVFAGYEKMNPPNLLLAVAEQTIFVPRSENDTIVKLHYITKLSPGMINDIKIFIPNFTKPYVIENKDILIAW